MKVRSLIKSILLPSLFALIFGFTTILNSKIEAVSTVPISYQGRLSNAAGALLTGNYNVLFCIYTSASATACTSTGTTVTLNGAVYGEVYSSLSTSNGVFNTQLGSGAAGISVANGGANGYSGTFPNFRLDNGTSYYIGITVGIDSEMTPRQQISASAYSVNSGLLDGYSASQAPIANQIPVLDSSGNLNLATTNPQINATGTNTLTLQGGTGTGNIQFFNSNNTLTSAGNLTIAGTINVNGTGNSNINGNLGIGTSSPIDQLDVAGKIPSSAISTTPTGTQPFSIYVQGLYTYITNSGSNTLQIFNISNPSSPVNVSSTTTNSTPGFITVQGKYAYVANTGANTMQIFDISNPAAPVNTSTISTDTFPYNIYVQGRYAYIANYTSNTLDIFDISNPYAPIRVSTTSTNGGGAADLYVQGNYAYIGNWTANTMQIFDISNPAAPVSKSVTSTGSLGGTTSSIFVQGSYAYIVSQGILIYDISNPSSPVLKGSIASSSTNVGYLQGRYYYVVTNNSIIIYDISNPSSPSIVGTISTSLNHGYNIFVQGRYAYALDYGLNNFQIIDVGGAYIQQLETGGIQTGTLSTQGNASIGNDLSVNGGLIVANGISSNGPFSVYGGGSASLLTVSQNGNVGVGTTNPQQALNLINGDNIAVNLPSPTGVSAALATGGSLTLNTTQYYKITALDGAGGETVASTEVNADPTTSGTQTVNLSWNAVRGATGYNIYRTTTSGTYTSPSLLANVTSTSYSDTGSVSMTSGTPPLVTTAYNIKISPNGNSWLNGGNLGIGTSAPIDQLDVAGTIPTTSTGAANTGLSLPVGVYVQGNYAYAVDTSSTPYLHIFDISSPSSPVQISQIATGNNADSVYVSGKYAYVVNGYYGNLYIYDISNPHTPTQVGLLSYGSSNLNDVFVQGRYAYIADITANALVVVDVSDPTNPTQVGFVSTSGYAYSEYVQGKYAYVGTNGGGGTFSVIDISNPLSPSIVGTLVTGETPKSIYVAGRYAYVSTDSGKMIRIIDISNPASPTSVSTLGTDSGFPRYAESVFVQGRYAYITYRDGNTLQVYDISNASSPVLAGSIPTYSGPSSVYVQGRFAYVTSISSNYLQTFDVGGAYIQQLETGGVQTGTLSTLGNASVGNDLSVNGGLSVANGISSKGPFSVYGGGTNSLFTVGQNGDVGIGTISPTAILDIPSTAASLPTNGLLHLDWSPTTPTTLSTDLMSLNVGPNGTVGNIFDIKNNGSSLFSVSQTALTTSLPASFNSPGDVSVAYDLNFTNPTSSYIKSSAPIYIQAGETFNSSDLTLRTFNSGQIVLDSPGGVTLNQAQNWTLASSTSALNFQDASANSILNLDAANDRVGIDTNTPSATLSILGTLTQSGGAANINASGTAATNIGNSTGILTLTSGGASSWIDSGVLTLETLSGNSMTIASGYTLNFTAGGSGIHNQSIDNSGWSLDDGNSSWATFSMPTTSATTAYSLWVPGISRGVSYPLTTSSVYTIFKAGTDTLTLTGSGTVTSEQDTNLFPYPTFTDTTTGSTINNATTLTLTGAPAATGQLTIGNSYGLKINSDTLSTSVTNAYGLSVAAPTGATNNYSAVFTGGNVGIGTSTPTDTLDVNGNLKLDTAGNKIKIAEGSNASEGTGALVGNGSATTITVTTSAVTANSRIYTQIDTTNGANATCSVPPSSGSFYVSTKTAGTSFVLTWSGTAPATSTNYCFDWWIIN